LEWLVEIQEFCSDQLENIPTMIIIYHVKLVQDHRSQLGDGAIVDGGIDKSICLESSLA